MQPFTLLQGIGQSAVFIFICWFYFYLPGNWILRKLRLTVPTPEHIALPLTIGILFFTLAVYLLSWIHALPVVYLPLIAIAWDSRNHLKFRLPWDKKHTASLAIVAILSILFTLPLTLSGIWGRTFFTSGDDLIHLAYTHELMAHFPPENPGFAGVPLLGYHFFADFILATTGTLSGIPAESLYYHFFPVLTAITIGFGVYSLLTLWTKRRSAALWGVFFVMFGGSFGFILRLVGHTGVSLTSTFGIDQPPSALLNWPFAFSLVLVTVWLIMIFQYLQTRNIRWLYLAAAATGLMPIFKVYAGIMVFAGFLFLCAVEIFRKKFRVAGSALVAVLIAAATFGVFAGKGSFLIWFPLWETRSMMMTNLPWYNFGEKFDTYSRLSVIRGLVKIEAYALTLFVLGNLGTRLIGILAGGYIAVKKRKLPSLFPLVLAVMAVTTLVIPLLFIQSVKVFEIIQLAWYYPFIASIFAAYGLGILTDMRMHRIARWTLVGVVVLCTLPSAYEIWTKYVMVPKTRPRISTFAPYLYLRSHGTYDDTVLELPPSGTGNTIDDLLGWYHDATTLHFPALADKRSYFHTTWTDFPNQDISGRAAVVQTIRNLASPSGSLSTDSENRRTLVAELHKQGIKYMYSPMRVPLFMVDASIREVYAANNSYIYAVQ